MKKLFFVIAMSFYGFLLSQGAGTTSTSHLIAVTDLVDTDIIQVTTSAGTRKMTFALFKKAFVSDIEDGITIESYDSGSGIYKIKLSDAYKDTVDANSAFKNAVDRDGDSKIESGGIDGEWVTLTHALPAIGTDSVAVAMPSGYADPEVVYIENSGYPVDFASATASLITAHVAMSGYGESINSRILIREK